MARRRIQEIFPKGCPQEVVIATQASFDLGCDRARLALIPLDHEPLDTDAVAKRINEAHAAGQYPVLTLHGAHAAPAVITADRTAPVWLAELDGASGVVSLVLHQGRPAAHPRMAPSPFNARGLAPRQRSAPSPELFRKLA